MESDTFVFNRVICSPVRSLEYSVILMAFVQCKELLQVLLECPLQSQDMPPLVLDQWRRLHITNTQDKRLIPTRCLMELAQLQLTNRRHRVLHNSSPSSLGSSSNRRPWDSLLRMVSLNP